jgi:hypothetical protein
MFFVIYYRGTITSLLSKISKITILGTTIEFFKSKELVTNKTLVEESIQGLSFVSNIDDSIQKLINSIQDDKESEFAIIDLGDGQKWLTSRLFIFSIIFDTFSFVKFFIFKDNNGFVGFANLDEIKKKLGKKYPWLQDSYIRAHFEESELRDNGNNTLLRDQIRTLDGGTQDTPVYLKNYLRNIQNEYGPDPIPYQNEFQDRVLLPSSQNTWERARWIDKVLLVNILGNSLRNSSVKLTAKSDERRIKEIINNEGNYIALIDKNNNFVSLVNRHNILEEIVQKNM